jgi:hypothetical protein
MRETARQAFEIGENPIAPLVAKLLQSPIEKDVVVHDVLVPPLFPCKPARRQVQILDPKSGTIALIQIRKSWTA